MQASPADNTLSARQQSRRRATEKPIASLACNKIKSGIVNSDQMAPYVGLPYFHHQKGGHLFNEIY